MQWSDEGVILSVRPHGETAAVAEIFTRAHGRHLGLVHGGRSRKLRPVLQTGNHVDAVWKARLAEHLGHVAVELRKGYAAQAMEDALALAGLSSLCTLARLLPERDPHPSLYEVTLFVLGYLDEPDVWPALMVRWELALLEELGFGLDLAACAATAQTTTSSTCRPSPAARSRLPRASPTRSGCCGSPPSSPRAARDRRRRRT